MKARIYAMETRSLAIPVKEFLAQGMKKKPADSGLKDDEVEEFLRSRLVPCQYR